MRILHFLETFSSLTETFIYDFIYGLEQAGHDNHVVTYRRENVEDRPFEKIYVLDFPPRLHPKRVWSRIVTLLHLVAQDEQYNFIIQQKLSEFVQKFKPNVIHAHFGPTGFIVEPVAKKLGVPLIVSFYGYDLSKQSTNPAWRHRYLILFQSATFIVVLSKEMEERAIKIGADPCKIRIIHLSKDANLYPYRKPAQQVQQWLTVGRLTEKKGHIDCIKAFALATKETSNTKLKIVGDGELYEKIQNFIHQNGLQLSVSLLGSRSHAQVKQLMWDADAFILCSKTAKSGDMEGTPTVLLEAQAMGLPCVATKHAGIPEIVPLSNSWLLADEGNISQIANCITMLQRCSIEQLEIISLKGRQLIEKEFNLEIEILKLINVYRSAMKH